MTALLRVALLVCVTVLGMLHPLPAQDPAAGLDAPGGNVPGPVPSSQDEGAGSDPRDDPETQGPAPGAPAVPDLSSLGGFGDARKVVRLSIGEAVRIALAHNLGVRIERLNYEKSIKDVVIARAAFDPVFATSYTMSKFRQPTVDFLSGVTGGAATSQIGVNPFTSQVFDFGLSGLLPSGATYSVTGSNRRGDNPESGFFSLNPRNNTSIQTSVTQPILKNFGFDSNLADLRISRNTQDSASLGFLRLQQTTIGDVHDAYWNLYFSRRDLDVKIKSLQEAQTLLEINRNKVRVGSAKRIDVITAEAEIETQKGGIIEAQNLLRTSQDNLLDVLQYADILRERDELDPQGPLYEALEVIPTTELQFRPYAINLGNAIRTALERREDYVQAQIDVDNADIELRRRQNQVLPTLNLQGTWTQSGLDENIGNSADELFSGRYYDWSVGINFEYPLGNREQESRLQKAMADLEISKLSLESKRDEIILEVTRLARDIDSTYQQVLSNQALSRLRGEQFQGEQQRLRVGSATSYQVQLVQTDHLEAQSLLLRARVDYQLAIMAFEEAIGVIGTSVAAE